MHLYTTVVKRYRRQKERIMNQPKKIYKVFATNFFLTIFKKINSFYLFYTSLTICAVNTIFSIYQRKVWPEN